MKNTDGMSESITDLRRSEALPQDHRDQPTELAET